MRTTDLYIGAIGTYLPETVTVQEASDQGLYPAEDIDLHQLAGVAVAGTTPAPEMARFAAVETLRRWGRPKDEVDLLLYASTWHQGPEGWLPHSYLQRHVVGGRAPVAEIRLGCNGILGSMELAAGYLDPDAGRTAALLVTADNYGTPLMNRWRLGPGFIPGDAATALVLTTEPGFARVTSVCTANIPEAEELHRGDEPLFPPGVTLGRSLDFASRFRSRGAAGEAVQGGLDRARGELVDLVDRAVEESGISRDDLARVAYINYSREIVEEACMKPLGLPMEKSTWDFGRTVGHCGASDQLLALNDQLRTGALKPGDHMLLLGTAPGINLACAVVKLLEVPSWIDEEGAAQ
ncbi:ketoacyl-ACP synthase III family protein [Amycolatopsis sp. cg13]|uniref:ketoacyl-ACP synthase III family protein n=1 Tax=Amycolatopsis sp. cg13 TaxID=3238807 RepID=UPI00352483BB